MGYQLIETISVGAGGAASIEFTGIDQTGVDLQVVVSARTNSTGPLSNIKVTLNNDTGSNYSYKYLIGSGSAAQSGGGSFTGLLGITGTTQATTANTFANSQIYIPNYSGASVKSVSAESVQENNGTNSYQHITAGSWNNTAAITSIILQVTTANNLVQYSSASLYKITAD